MNTNETSILPHTAALSIAQRADILVDTWREDTGEDLSSVGVLLAVVQTVNENAGFPVELRITRDGYQIAFPQHVETSEVLRAFDHAFEVQDDILQADDE